MKQMIFMTKNSTYMEKLRKEYFVAVEQGKVKDIETAWTWFAPHLSNKSELREDTPNNTTDTSVILSAGTIMGGQPCITGTRITKKTIDNLIEKGVSVEEILTDYYPQNRKEITAYLSSNKSELKKVNRVEVIDYTKDFEQGGGRAYVKWEDGIKVDWELQDDGRTLKVFILSSDEKEEK